MYLEIWQLIVLACLYGICAIWNKRQGIIIGVHSALRFLEESEIINISEEGNIYRYKDNISKNV